MSQPSFPDRAQFPFAPHYLDVGPGRLHYVDEGQGPAVLMVHGTPTWSFLYRHLITKLSPDYRCIAVDHLGFGLSDRPRGWGYRPADHAANLTAFIEGLDLRDITLMVHDFGGPIGLAYAVEHPENVARLVLFNTWMWSLEGDPHFERAARLLGGRLGRLLYTRASFSTRVLLRSSWRNKERLSPAVYRQYADAFPSPEDRLPLWTLARELIASSAWFDGLWQRRDRITDKPALLAWGMKDPAFRPSELARWQALLARAVTVPFPDAGHFVQEEAPEAPETVRTFLSESRREGDEPVSGSTGLVTPTG
jgi:haloalkane dehalogenase